MDEKWIEDEFSHWFSTYGVITAQRILSRYQITLPSKELLPAIKNANSFYHQLIQVPLKNVLNGIILQQANDYHVYGQKLFIDYLLSGESSKPEDAQGASTREFLEEERKQLTDLGERFTQKQLDHERLISLSQNGLIKLTQEWQQVFTSGIEATNRLLALNGITTSKDSIKSGIIHALIVCGIAGAQDKNSKGVFIDKVNELVNISMTVELKEQLINQLSPFFAVLLRVNEQINDYLIRVKEMGAEARAYRGEFYNSVLKIIDLMNLLPEYKINPEQDAINRESLYFDKSIGEAEI